jgi:alpha,alpha-trehalose phosphorylase
LQHEDRRGSRRYSQDSRFLEHEPWPAAEIPPEKRPLLLHYHSLVIYRRQVLKQADVVLALLLLSDQFTAEQKRADFAYYDPLTTGDSSLSAPTQAILASETGHPRAALEHFASTLFTDLANSHENTRDGVHIASVAGLWGILVQGFGGLRDSGRQPSLNPQLPQGWESLRFRLTIHGSLIEVLVTPQRTETRLIEGEPLKLMVDNALRMIS